MSIIERVGLTQGHQSTITTVQVMADSRRVVSIDKQGNLAIWAADNGTKLFTAKGPTTFLAATIDTKFIVCGDGDCW